MMEESGKGKETKAKWSKDTNVKRSKVTNANLSRDYYIKKRRDLIKKGNKATNSELKDTEKNSTF